jgi:hypothetical protein
MLLAQVAFQAADYVGWNVWASINKRPLLPFKYQHLGDMMALGLQDGAVAFPIGGITLDGPYPTTAHNYHREVEVSPPREVAHSPQGQTNLYSSSSSSSYEQPIPHSVDKSILSSTSTWGI